MAIMYPNRFPDDNKSSGEKKVFEYFKKTAPSDWIVLHSYMLPEHSKVIFGEADFIVIGPKIGVVVLEIKSGGVGFDGSEWLFRDRFGNITKKLRGPFAQAREAMFKIEEIIQKQLTESFDKYNVLYNYAVIFTDEGDFPIEKFPEWEPWRLFQNEFVNDYCSFIMSLTNNFLNELKTLGKHLPPELSFDSVKRIAEALRPSVECTIPLKKFLESSEEDIIQLTSEQFHCLDDIEENERILITGGAGTGKTLIAIETAKMQAARNTNILFLCYNNNLATFLKTVLKHSNIHIYSLHKFLMSIYKNDIPTDVSLSVFFNSILPVEAIKKIDDEKIQYDYLIIDEFQDICTREYIDFFNSILTNGIKNGRFAFFADFSRQAIYEKKSNISNLEDKTFFARKKLSINCRNTKNIGNELLNITGFEDTKYKLSILGEKVDYVVWNDIDEESKQIRNIIKNLNKLRIPSEQIIILSPYQRKKSVVNIIDPDIDFISDYEDKEADGFFALFSTIQAYKGLESKIVILCDIENYDDKYLMYVGFSRARSKLIVFESTNANLQRIKLMARR